ncbi:heme exporter protein CcmB [Desulfohalovibrio reitneri]|uniref:heme exporter protein CcmB n=1 Tax=Desulfohalovibrio reitneri TaxID=1307759 RepID=UPI0004A6C00A|nr:heme exporter protein CcmB [Desulfohalovibrio reitneri]
MLRAAWTVAGKDLRLLVSGGQGLVQAGLLGLVLIFLFSLSRGAGEATPPQAAAVIFWLATAFALVLVFNALYALEEETGARRGLLLAPCPVQSVWLGKAVSGLAALLLAQAVFAPATIVFLGQEVGPGWLEAAGTALVVDWGLVVLGSLLGALSQGAASRESILTVVLFPLLVPALLAGVKTGSAALGGGDASGWLGLAVGFDALFTAAALVLFPFVYGEES